MSRNHDIKWDDEKQLLRYFIRSYPDFPKGKVEKSESPDFTVQTSRHRVTGIEMTRLFLLKGKDEVHFVPHPGTRRAAFVNLVKQVFLAQNNFHLYAHFELNDHFEELVEDLGAHAAGLSNLLTKKMQGLNPNTYFHLKVRKKELPHYLNAISLIHHPDDAISDFVSCEGMVPVDNYLESIELAISQKQEKMSLYQKNRFDQYWLLIVADCLNCATPFNMHKMLEKWQFSSDFHQIFLFELFEQKVHILSRMHT